jgi:dsRNA-specific ribonuclease
MYEVEVTVSDVVVGRGGGTSKKAAEEAAAQDAYEKLANGELALSDLA